MDYGKLGEESLFELPKDMLMKVPIQSSLEPFVEAHPFEDNEALRAFIKS